MIRTRFAKPALVVLGFTVLVVLYASVQRARTNAYSVAPAAFQQFDQSAQNAALPQPDSQEAAYASMPQSGYDAAGGQAGQGQVGQGTPSHANDTYIGYDDQRSIRGQAQNGQALSSSLRVRHNPRILLLFVSAKRAARITLPSYTEAPLFGFPRYPFGC